MQFATTLYDKICLQQLYEQLLEIPEFPPDSEDFDEGFESINIKMTDKAYEVKKNESY